MNDSDFAGAIGLVDDWPVDARAEGVMSARGLCIWARAYLDAAEILQDAQSFPDGSPVEGEGVLGPHFYGGPAVHTTGLATELTLKAMLRGGGLSEKQVRKFGHRTYDAYLRAREFFIEHQFIYLHMDNTNHRQTPKEVLEAVAANPDNADDPNRIWRVYFNHLRVLDGVYDRPFRTRYAKPGEVLYPDNELLLIGTKILLTAMEERLLD